MAPRNGLALFVFFAALVCPSAWCMPNIRIQVNNENYKSPPYLLEAIRQAEASDSAQPGLAQPSAHPAAAAEEQEQAQPNGPFNVVKEETIERILDLQPDTVLRLAPESLASQVSSQDYAKLDGPSSSVSLEQGAPVELLASVQHQHLRNPQLPVTGSHLKRPSGSSGILDDGSELDSAASSMLSEVRAQMDDETEAALGAGPSRAHTMAKSRVSPSVAADPGVISVNLDGPKALGQNNQPDTLELSQVMSGVSNASQVPATVTRNYGANSRTRVTVGGGYVRNKQDQEPDAELSQSGERQDKRKLPAGALERPSQQDDDQEPSRRPNQEESRLVKVPERLVLSDNIFTGQEPSQDQQQQQQQQQMIAGDKNFLLLNVTSTKVQQQPPPGKRDSRCPASGTKTFEHPSACDRYFFCEDGYASEYTCPNGLMYGTRNLVKDYCVHRWEAICGDKSVPNPISSPGCRWQWGLFSVQGSPRCTPDFYECREGEFEVRKCTTSGQVYDDRTKSCRFAEQVGCAEEALADFKCPPDDQANTYWPFPRYFLNERALIHCVNDKPAIVRCRDNERVDPEHLHCVMASKLSSSGQAADGLASKSLREKSKKDQ